MTQMNQWNCTTTAELKWQENVYGEQRESARSDICMFPLLNRKVDISTPVVSFATWSDICDAYEKPCVFIRIAYTVGLDGSNILVLKEHDVKVITDLMMGGDGTNTDGELGEVTFKCNQRSDESDDGFRSDLSFLYAE